MARNRINAYQQTKIKTAGAGQRVVLMYDVLLKALHDALQAFEMSGPERFEAIHNHLQLSEKIVTELRLALDMDNGGEIARTLDTLYEFWDNHLSDANINKDRKKVEEVLVMVKDMHATWKQAAIEAKKLGLA